MSRNTKVVPEAAAALEQFKYEVANEIGVPLKKGYNGDLTSFQNGSVGGYMVKNVCPARTLIHRRQKLINGGFAQNITYQYSLVI